MQPIDVSPGDLETVQRILQEHVPELEVRAFGSRVSWTARETSDLDLALMTTQPLDLLCVAEMREAFDESDLPFRVDLVDWASTSKNFRKVIKREYVAIAEGKDRSESGIWPTVTLGDCAVLVRETISPSDGEDIPYIGLEHIGENTLSLLGHGTASDVISMKACFQSGDILFGKLRPYFRKVVRAPFNGICSTDIWVVRAKEKVDQGFLYYCMASQPFVDFATLGSEGTRMPRAKWEYVLRYEILLPPLPEQRAIAHILGTLDDKIEQNRRMNETLEAMAQALFKSWFIDFDPVHAKATLKQQAASKITPPLRGSRQAKGASPQARRWGVIRRGYTQRTLTTAQTLRRNRTDAEGLLWHYLRNNQLDGHRFRRQHPIGPYIVDFACLARKVLIELDGSQHAGRQADDKKRDAFLRAQGYRVLRFWNNEIFENCFGVLERIYEAVTENPPPQPPAPDGLTAPTPPQGGSDWTVERARAYLNGMSPEIAALFPDRFVDSELGKIPAGWSVGRFGDIVDQVTDKENPFTSPDTLYHHFSIPAFDEGQWPRTERGENIKSQKLRVFPGVVLLSKLNPEIDRVWLVDVQQGEQAVCSTEFLVFRPRSPYGTTFSYCLGRSSGFRQALRSLVTGTSKSHQRAPANAIFALQVVLCPKPLSDAFEMAATTCLQKSRVNRRESRILATLRDVLLPKLISGEIRVSDRNICVQEG